MISRLLCLILLFAAHSSFAQLAQQLDQYSRASLTEYYEFLSLACDANHPEELTANIAWCKKAFEKRGFTVKQLDMPRIPILLASRNHKDAIKTVLFYVQVDGQPVDSTKWQQPSPWTPTLKEQQADGSWKSIDWYNLEGEINPDWRVFARAASDAKGPINMFLAALDVMITRKEMPNYNIKVIMDTEEELGSPYLPAAVQKYKKELAADMFVILDGPRHFNNVPTLAFGARGIATIHLESFGPKVPQHSGHYGNYVPNPALKMAQLLASMKDEHGRVSIPGFYDGIQLTDEIKTQLAEVPDDEDAIRRKIGFAKADGVGENLQEAIQYPSLNIRGLSSGWVNDKVRTIIPDKAIAEIDVRLVLESDPERLLKLIRRHIEQQDFFITEGMPTDEERARHPNLISWRSKISYQAFRTNFDTEIGRWL
ncbi:MAG: peptidase dimerization domain-containing protein, partial [Bacteroidota bacterium]